ncbi:MAG TPA: ferredoxin reductase [Propionibacterium sp.]|nr:ferredoxin reductase [Propionibacterium sp.]
MRRRRPLAEIISALTYPLHVDDITALFDPRYSSKQPRARVTKVVREGPRTATIRFHAPPGWREHQAGQWVRVGVEIDGVRHWRSYSLSTAPGQDPAITVTDIGQVSGELVRRVRRGDILYLDPPQGEFVLPEHPRPLLMITGGSGITPVMSMLRTLAGRRADADVVVLHAARTRADALFVDELDALAQSAPNVQHMLWLSGEQGRLDLTTVDTLDRLCPDWRDRAAYVCGPEGMVADAERLWADEGAGDHLTMERFNVSRVDGPAGEGGTVTFTRSDREVAVDGATTLLEAGEADGVALPSGCRMGICRTCLTKLDAGRVRDLTTGEVHGDPGDLIRTCVSAPAGDVQLDA